MAKQGQCWCMYYQRPHSRAKEMTIYSVNEEDMPDHNRRRKKDLVVKGQAHGILVYDEQPTCRMVCVWSARGVPACRQRPIVPQVMIEEQGLETLANNLLLRRHRVQKKRSGSDCVSSRACSYTQARRRHRRSLSKSLQSRRLRFTLVRNDRDA